MPLFFPSDDTHFELFVHFQDQHRSALAEGVNDKNAIDRRSFRFGSKINFDSRLEEAQPLFTANQEAFAYRPERRGP